MQCTRDLETIGSPFGAELSLDDLLRMAFVELREARDRITASRELLGLRAPASRDSGATTRICTEDLLLI